MLAGLGCALKPRYAGVFVVLEGLALLRGLNPFRTMPVVAGTTMLAYAGLVALFCPAYLRRAVPLALALYGATDVPLRHLVMDSLRLMLGQAVALLLWWNSRRRMPEANLMLTLVVFAITSTAICFMDGKDWFYHRLPATIATVLALLCWAASALVHRRPAARGAVLPVAAGAVAFVVFLVAAFQRLEPQVALAVEPEQGTVVKLERLIRQQKARTYIAFSEWIALGLPGGEQHRRRLGLAFRFDVGTQGRTLARPLRCRRRPRNGRSAAGSRTISSSAVPTSPWSIRATAW